MAATLLTRKISVSAALYAVRTVVSTTILIALDVPERWDAAASIVRFAAREELTAFHVAAVVQRVSAMDAPFSTLSATA